MNAAQLSCESRSPIFSYEPGRKVKGEYLLRTAVEIAIREVHKLLGTGGVPTSLTSLFWRWLTISLVFTGRSARAICSRLPPLPLLLLDHIALRPQNRSGLLGTGTGGRGRKSEGLTTDTSRKRPWTAARTMEALKRCPLAIAQRLVHCAIAVSTAVLGQSHKDNVRCTAVEEQLEAKEVQLSQPSSTSLLMISSGLT